MLSLLLSKNFWIILAVIAGFLMIFLMAHKIYVAGETTIIADQRLGQVNEDVKVRKIDVKVKNSIPTDNAARVAFLLDHTSNR